jgi:hypothetical protein
MKSVNHFQDETQDNELTFRPDKNNSFPADNSSASQERSYMVDSSRSDKNSSAPVDRHADLKHVIGRNRNLADGKFLIFFYARTNLWKRHIAGLRREGE